MTEDVNFEYYCYRCGAKNQITLPCPTAPEFHHLDLQCRSCGDGTRVILSHCPSCSTFIYWIDDMSIPELVTGFAAVASILDKVGQVFIYCAEEHDSEVHPTRTRSSRSCAQCRFLGGQHSGVQDCPINNERYLQANKTNRML